MSEVDKKMSVKNRIYQCQMRQVPKFQTYEILLFSLKHVAVS